MIKKIQAFILLAVCASMVGVLSEGIREKGWSHFRSPHGDTAWNPCFP